jgi:hypothetical protein
MPISPDTRDRLITTVAQLLRSAALPSGAAVRTAVPPLR